MRLIADIALGLLGSILETLPSDEKEAGVFLSGLVWSFVLHWTMLILVTLAWFGAQR